MKKNISDVKKMLEKDMQVIKETLGLNAPAIRSCDKTFLSLVARKSN